MTAFSFKKYFQNHFFHRMSKKIESLFLPKSLTSEALISAADLPRLMTSEIACSASGSFAFCKKILITSNYQTTHQVIIVGLPIAHEVNQDKCSIFSW